MTWEAIQAVAQAGQAEAASDVLPATAPLPVAAPAGQFGDMVNQGLTGVNQQLLGSQTDLQQLAVGDVQNLHQVMIRLEESRLSFQLLLQVRNRLLEAYQDVMKMQV
ncbi:flagellar hook-basal body complex protein FliE [Ralstonia pickettii]|uniref:Flagellar hook-basal body complex protein FliE n=1 Tax=Ralstonia pickettii TaxID=329 RepID=A0A7X2LAL3_RALPI|nr:flagellar hook-basal body complex protein FliE [Ralstonia pickettii]MRT00159.1 flagellar hook-basal body complex protein FliE [Ralstonia pickettii]NWK44764.1 flagellar hook-basal body complex protein FliE [Ralstonia pickettii]